MAAVKFTKLVTTRLTLRLTADDLADTTLNQLLAKYEFKAADVKFIGFKVPHDCCRGDLAQLSKDCPLIIELEKTCIT